jgi:heat shock protein HslJ
MKRTILSAALFAGISIFLTSCSNTKKATMPATVTPTQSAGMEILSAGDWKLAELEGTMIPRDSKAMLSFIAGEKNAVAGNAGCNRLTGSVELPGKNALKFSPLATTRMACFDQKATETEAKFLAVLGKVDTWEVTGTNLTLSQGSAVLAKFRNIKRLSKDEARLDATWEMNYISGPRIAFDGLYPDKKPTLIFNLAESEVGGNSSCNGFGARVKIDGNNISFSDPIGTMMACPGNGEQTFYKTLKTVTSYKLEDDNTLSLLAGEIPVMKFVKK